jgi:hypothetical protein
MLKTLIAATAVSFLWSVSASARPMKLDAQNFSDEKPATMDELNGMASLSCSGGFIDIGRKANERAVIITNGHCATSPMMGANQAIVNVPYSRSGIQIADPEGRWLRMTPTKVLYATLTGTDLALIELKETNEELLNQGIRQFKVAAQSPALNTSIRITSGFWKKTQECELDRVVHKLIEGFGNSQPPSVATGVFAVTSGCKIYGGFSGTPVVDKETQEIVALAFTSAEGGADCAEQNPCEEDEQGVRKMVPGMSYMARVNDVAGCLKAGNVDLTLATCQLYRP